MKRGEAMNLKRIFILTISVLIGFALLAIAPVFLSTANAQVYIYTPTAEANGSIYYIVKSGDTCDSISLVNNVPLDTLRALNQLKLDDCRFLQIGRKLLIGSVPTAVVTAGPSPTPTSILPTPQPVKGFGTICVYLYNDINGNAMAEPTETTLTGLAGGEISVISKNGEYSKTGTSTDTGSPVCFEDAPEGEYTISIAIPDGYNATASQNYTILLKAGDTSTIDFSAQPGSRLITSNKEGGSSVFLAILGGLILLGGVGLGLYVKFFLRK
jgi:LysM repeat protein